MPGKTLSMDHMLVVTNSQHWSKNVYTQGKALITSRYNKPGRNGCYVSSLSAVSLTACKAVFAVLLKLIVL